MQQKESLNSGRELLHERSYVFFCVCSSDGYPEPRLLYCGRPYSRYVDARFIQALREMKGILDPFHLQGNDGCFAFSCVISLPFQEGKCKVSVIPEPLEQFRGALHEFDGL